MLEIFSIVLLQFDHQSSEQKISLSNLMYTIRAVHENSFSFFAALSRMQRSTSGFRACFESDKSSYMPHV